MVIVLPCLAMRCKLPTRRMTSPAFEAGVKQACQLLSQELGQDLVQAPSFYVGEYVLEFSQARSRRRSQDLVSEHDARMC